MISRWWQALQRRRERRTLARRAIPEALWALTLARYPFLGRLPEADRERLRELATLFLAAKEFGAAPGIEVSDEMAVAVAAQACLPVLRLGLAWYDGFVGIFMQPEAVRVRREHVDEIGVVHEVEDTLAGETVEGGPLMLAWPDVAEAGESAQWGYNVVIHEFAHVLDLRDGVADGIPPLAGRAARERWREVLQTHYETHCAEVDDGVETLLDPYGAEAPDEFFAVASEAFFVASAELRDRHPELYGLLAGFYRLDPAAWEGARR